MVDKQAHLDAIGHAIAIAHGGGQLKKTAELTPGARRHKIEPLATRRWRAVFPLQVTRMDTFHICLALGPLAIYLLLLGAMNLGRRPFMITGARDVAALGIALAGFILSGPMQLFLPEEAALHFGGYVWLLLLAFYLLCIVLWILVARPRLVVYNITLDKLRPLLMELAPALDSQAAWAGNSLTLPGLCVQLHLEDFPLMQNVSLVANGEDQSHSGWQRLERALRGRLHQTEVQRNPRGVTLVTSGLLMLGMMVYKAAENPQAVAQGFRDMLQL